MEEKKPIRLLVVDDHETLRNSLKQAMEIYDDIHHVGDVDNGADAVQFCDENQPDVILMDLFMPEMDGIKATRLIQENHPYIGIILWSFSGVPEMHQRALNSGATLVLEKNESLDVLVNHIREVASLVSQEQ